MIDFIPYGKQYVDAEDIDAVKNILTSTYLTQGSVVEQFEAALYSFVESNFATVVNSATSALHLACLALGVSDMSLVWTSPITFVASSNAPLMCGASVDFVDIDETLCMCPNKLQEKLLGAVKAGTIPDVIIVVHMCGQSADMARIRNITAPYGIKIIEDASHAIGGKYKGKNIGCCEFSEITVFSFHPVKIITTGEGGSATTNSAKLDRYIKLYRSHGITRDKKYFENKNEEPWFYEQSELGYNYRLTDIQCALGISQLSKITKFVEDRHRIAKNYCEKLSSSPCDFIPQYSYSSFHLYIIRLQLEKIKKTRLQVFNFLRDSNIGVNVHYIPVHTQPFYKNLGFKQGQFPESEKYYSEAITLPLFPSLTGREQTYVIEKLNQALDL